MVTVQAHGVRQLGEHGGRAWGSWSHCTQSQEAGMGKCWCSACFLFFIQSGTLSCGMVLPTLKVGVVQILIGFSNKNPESDNWA